MPTNIAYSDKGTWHQVAIDPPLQTIVGDVIRVIGNQILVERNNVIVAVRDIGQSTLFNAAIDQNQTLDNAIFFRRSNVSGIAISLVDVQTTGSSVLAAFSDSTSLETDLTTLQQDAASVNQNTDLAKQLLLAALIARQPTLNDANAISGSTVSIDMAGATPIVFTLVENA